MKTPTAAAAREASSVPHTVPVKRSASCGAVTVDEVHQPSTSYQSSAVKHATSASSDLRYIRYVNIFRKLFGTYLSLALLSNY